MPTFDLKAYARRGAEVRLAELHEELKAIYGAFPELREGRSRAKVVVNHEEQSTGLRAGRTGIRGRSAAPASQESAANGGVAQGARKRRKMTAAERKAVGERMRKYWAARRKAVK